MILEATLLAVGWKEKKGILLDGHNRMGFVFVKTSDNRIDCGFLVGCIFNA